jgi:DNA-binding response OmpR family regulator
MLVDDDRTTATLLETLLSLDGFDVILAARGSEVLEKARREQT